MSIRLVRNSKSSRLAVLVVINVLFFASLPAWGGVETTRLDLTLSGLSFNQNLRTDRGPSSGVAQSTTYSPPDTSRQDLVSTAVPAAVADARLRQMRRASIFWVAPGEISLSWEVLFQNPRFNGIVPTLGTSQGSKVDSRVAATEMTVGRDGMTDPIRRRWLFYKGTPVSLGRDGYFDTAYFLDGAMDVGIKRCHEYQPGFRINYDSPRRLDASCETDLARQICDGFDTSISQLPWSVFDCRVDIQEDTGFTVFVSDASGRDVRTKYPSLNHQRLETQTHFRVVEGPRRLSRLLSHVPFQEGGQASDYECDRFYSGPSPYADAEESMPCTEADHEAIELLAERDPACDLAPTPGSLTELLVKSGSCGSGLTSTSPLAKFGQPSFTRLRSTWRFQVLQIQTTGDLLETFSDELRISEIRIFVERNGVREYILADEIQRISVNGQDCEIPDAADVAVVDMNLCIEDENDATRTRRRITATPTWVEPDVQTLAEWEVTFRTYNQGGTFTRGLAVQPGERVFLEFTMVQR